MVMVGGVRSTTAVLVNVGFTRALNVGSPAGQCDVVGSGNDAGVTVTSNSLIRVVTEVPAAPSIAITAENGGGVKLSLPTPSVPWSVTDAIASESVPSPLTAMDEPFTWLPAPVSTALTK